MNELGVSSPDNRTLVIELKEPCPYFVALTTMAVFTPCSEDFFTTVGNDYANSASTMLSCGPYIIDRYEPLAMQIHFSKNPYYYDPERIKPDGITLQVVSNVQQALMCYKSGFADAMEVSGEIAELADGDPELHIFPSATVSYIDINHLTCPALANKNIRIALSKSVDRKDLTDNLLKAGNYPLTRIVPPDFYKETNGTYFGADTSRYDEYSAYDPDAAKKFWEQGLSELGVSSLSLNFTYSSGEANVAEATAAQMKRTLPGLDIELRPVTFKERSRIHNSGEFDLILMGWVADYSDPTAFLSLFISGAYAAVFNNKEYDDIYGLCQSEELAKDPERRDSLLHDAKSILMENAAAIPLYGTGTAYLVRHVVKGLQFKPTGVGLIVTGLEKEVG